METWSWVLIIVVVGIICFIGGFFFARWFLKRELKKNPPVNENMIRAMYMQMGRKPSEAQVKAVINAMKKNQN